MDLIYDGTIEGLMTTFFTIYEKRVSDPIIYKSRDYQPALFAPKMTIETNQARSERVLKGLKTKAGRQFQQFFYALHNDRDPIENDLFAYANYLFSNEHKRSSDYSNPAVLKIAQCAKSVGREKHRMEAFVRFRLTKDGVYFAAIEPDFDVIPLIRKHFQERYGDQKWMIYDLHRDYGIYYDLEKTSSVHLTFNGGKMGILDSSPAIFTTEELAFQELWSLYFQRTNIPSRKNMKLHLQHVPKRYWKYLSEKTVRV